MRDGQIVPFLPIDWSLARHVRLAHGVMAAMAFLAFFPIGGITVAVLPGIIGTAVHAVLQITGLIFYLIAFAMGLWMATTIRWRGFSFFENYHPIIGIVIFIVLIFQPISGLLHHLGYRRHGHRTFISFIHVWFGRIFIVLGMINGGLGLYITGNTSYGHITAYAVIAAMIFIVWMIAALFGEVKRFRGDVPPQRMHRNGVARKY